MKLGWQKLFSLPLAIVLALSLRPVPAAAGADKEYSVHPLVSNVAGAAPRTDPNLVNAWGLVAGPATPWWVADNGTSLSTLYRADGSIVPLVVQVPVHPSGAVFWAAGVRARFVFDTEAGQVRGWLPAQGNQTIVLADRSAVGAIYKGLALATTAAGDRFYATDFHNGRVDVFDSSFNLVTGAGAFVDPALPSGYAPFGIQTIGSRVFVTYAKQGPDAVDEIHGQGKGFVDVYDTNGNFVRRLVTRRPLNSPWGLAMAPSTWGNLAGDLLVGNFGDGAINAFDPVTGAFHGSLKTENGAKLQIDGPWGLKFGNGGSGGDPNVLYFTAGPDDEMNGLFGSLTQVQ